MCEMESLFPLLWIPFQQEPLIILTAKVLSPTLEEMRPSMAPCSVSNSCSLCSRPWWSLLQARTDTTDSRARTTTGPSTKRAKVSTRYRTGSPAGSSSGGKGRKEVDRVDHYCIRQLISLLILNTLGTTFHLPDGSKDIRELLVVLSLHMYSEQQNMAWWRDGAVKQCKRIFWGPFRQPCSKTIPLLPTLTEEKHRVPWHWVACWHLGLSHRHTNCPSVEEMTGVHYTLLLFRSA